MAHQHQQDVYGGNPTTHQPVVSGGGGQTDQYGNPIPQAGYGSAGTGTTGIIHGAGEHHHQSGVLHRSGSSSSSSSEEDDGQGGRRKKKGMKEKIKEKITGVGHKDEQQKHTGATTTPAQGQHHKGMMEKIKEKFPGTH